LLSHSNAKSVYDTTRNVPTGLLEAISTSCGVIGAAEFPGMVSSSKRPTLTDLIAHIEAIVRTVGIDYVGLGIDYYALQADVASDEIATHIYEELVRKGVWSTSYPSSSHHYPAGVGTTRTLVNLTYRLS
jgi:microsomal dipeptidase-like Zn-dependent dipeptidase